MTHENRFGMFIHWGFYALHGVQEQEFARLDLPREEYESAMHEFNPVEFDPDAIVSLAKETGMEYICFTAKHHDGFCMFDSEYTDYKITNTPYGKDVLKELADACRRQGLLLSIYYSCPDWHHPYGYNPNSSHQWKARRDTEARHEIYLEYVKNQIRELMTKYGPIYTLFWDIPPKIDVPEMNEMVRALQPGIFINNRGYGPGDFSTPEREYQSSESGRFPTMTEACNSLGEQSWGYRKDEDYYSLRHLTTSIDRMMAKGASYLLNVGPDALGRIPEESLKRLRAVGSWYRRMNGALTCHEDDPFDYEVRGSRPIVTKKDGKTYFHFPDGLRSSAFSLGAWPGEPKRVTLLNTGKALRFSFDLLPEYMKNGLAQRFLHVTGIPVDELENESIVVEIEWN